MPRRRSGGRPALRAASRPAPARNPPPLPGMENDEIVPNQVYDSNQPIAPYDRVPTPCYHLSGDNEILSDGLKDFQIGCHLPWAILKDFQIGTIGSLKDFQRDLSRRANDAITLRQVPRFRCYERVYGRNETFDMEERKLFISSGCNHLWQEKLYGIKRVGVYGVDTICVVTRNKDFVQLEKDLRRLRGSTYGLVRSLPRALIFEVEDLACPPGESRQRVRKRSQKPFGLVSVTACTNKQASRDKSHEVQAIEYLREEMNNSASTFTYFKTVKTAICAFQHLFGKKFKPNEIRVVVWKNRVVRKRDNDDDDDTLSDDEYVGEIVKELKVRDERSVKDIFAAGSGSEGAPHWPERL